MGLMSSRSVQEEHPQSGAADLQAWRAVPLPRPLLSTDEDAGPVSDAVVFAPTLPMNEAGFDRAMANKAPFVVLPYGGGNVETDRVVALASVLCHRTMLRAADERDRKIAVGFMVQAYSKLLEDAGLRAQTCPLARGWVDAVFVCSVVNTAARYMGEDAKYKVGAVHVAGLTLKQLRPPSAPYGHDVERFVDAASNFYTFGGELSVGCRQMAGIATDLYEQARAHAKDLERVLSSVE